MDEDSDKT